MLKKSLIALAIVAAAAVPAFAGTDAIFNSSTTDQLAYSKAVVINELQNKGVNAQDVDSWGQYIRAEVKLADGTQAVRFFAPDTLQQVDIAHLN
jgi:hypothetical protein